MKKNYNIGLDIGTSSVGWAIVECNTQKVIRRNGKSLWGVRIFNSAATAEDRRIHRSNRRRLDRRRQRVKLLQNEFENEINKIDKDFYKKLNDFKYNKNDKINKKIELSNDDKKIINGYKTIYHLREHLINSNEKEDIRLIYLAIHHIIKYRGNFLISNDSFNINNIDLKEKLNNLFNTIVNLCPNTNIPDDYDGLINIDELSKSLLNPNKNDIKIMIDSQLKDILGKDFSTNFYKMIAGYKFNINKILNIDSNLNISFGNNDFDEKYSEYEGKLEDKIEILELLKELYDTVYLKKLFKSNNTNISSLMVDKYNIQKNDLKFLKSFFKKNRILYNKIFKTKNGYCLYDKYMHNQITYEEFKNELFKLINKLIESKLYYDNDLNKYNLNIKQRIENDEFLPRITSPENGKYPYQLNKYELIKILENQGKYYPFLLNKTNDGYYKIVKLLEFKIPYYVGPLVSDTKSKNAWMEKLVNVPITPYNFDEVVNKELSATKFIKRMISHCTYLLDEKALPNNSILYCEFKVLNELKQIKINGEKLSNEQQKDIIENLFKKVSGTITNKKFVDYLKTKNQFNMYDDINISGYSSDNKFANNLQSYNDFFGTNGIFKNTEYNLDDAEAIIELITIFEDKDMLKKKIKRDYSELSEYQVNQIINKKYKGWGNLSKKLLTTKYYNDKKEMKNKSIVDLMNETNENFMQIINNNKYKFQNMIKEYNQSNEKTLIDSVNELATSPSTKRGIYQSLLIVDELINYIGYKPKNIIIEMARSNEKKVRTIDRKKYLIELYKKQKEQIDNYNNLINELNKREFNKKKIDSEKLFLYFIQEGKCLYSGKPLNIDELNLYEIDHIIPRTLIKDDSIDNKALVYRECNQNKAASYILPKEYRNQYNIKWWEKLKRIGLMSAKKFHNLIRYEYKQEEIDGFINRQLVETRQITKHVANIISNLYKDTNVVYLKAELSSNYRDKYELFKFRNLNDYHHAHDAYLAAVLGEYKEKYFKYKFDFEYIKELNDKLRKNYEYEKLKYGYIINSLDINVNNAMNELFKNLLNNKNNECLIDINEFNKIVSNHLYRNDIIISRKTEIRSGRFYKETLLPKSKGNVKIKDNMPTNIYGGYSNIETSYMCLIKYNNKTKLIGIPKQIIAKKDNNAKMKFIKEHLNIKNDNFIILKDKIPFEIEIIFKNQHTYITGYSVNKKNNELCNAHQLKIKKENMIKWSKALAYFLNDKIKYEDDAVKYGNDIISFLLCQEKNFPLFSKEIISIKNKINLENIDLSQKKKLISQLLNLYHCNSTNANLTDFNLKDRIGRLSGKSIDNGTIISKSVTGLKEAIYEF